MVTEPVLAFEETEKMLALRPVNEILSIYALHENKPKRWPGKKLTLYPVVGDWFGQKNVCAIRVRIPKGDKRPFVPPEQLGRDITGEKA